MVPIPTLFTQYTCKNPQNDHHLIFIDLVKIQQTQQEKKSLSKYLWTALYSMCWSCACPSVFTVLHCNPEAKQIHLHANYNSNLPAQAFQTTPDNPFLMPHIQCNHRKDAYLHSHKKKKKDLKILPTGKVIAHLLEASVWKHKAFNNLLHNHCFDVDGMLRMKGQQLCTWVYTAETWAFTTKTPWDVCKNVFEVQFRFIDMTSTVYSKKCSSNDPTWIKKLYTGSFI